MTKTAIGAAVAALTLPIAFTASAAQVQIYGLVDEGLSYISKDLDDGNSSQDSFEVKSGMSVGSRIGIKGEEDLGNGLKVGFILENGFEADSGEFAKATSTRLFGREASLYISDDSFGTFAFGRLQHLTAGYGTWGVAAGILNPYAIGWSDHIAGYKNVFGFNSGRLDNVIAWKSPTFNNFTAYAQWASNTDQYNGPEGAEENKGTADRYGSLGLAYRGERFSAIGTVEWTPWSSKRADTAKADDGIALTLGANYQFDFGKLYLAGQYFDNQWRLPTPSEIVPLAFNNGTINDRMVKGYGVVAGANIPALGGNVLLSLGYRDAELVNYSDIGATRVSGTIGYRYPLSKRTNIYTAASYTRDDLDKQVAAGSTETENVNPDAMQIVLGLVHRF